MDNEIIKNVFVTCAPTIGCIGGLHAFTVAHIYLHFVARSGIKQLNRQLFAFLYQSCIQKQSYLA